MLDVVFNDKTNFFEYRNWYSQYDDVDSLCIIKCSQNANAKFTIAIPTYKRPQLLREAIDSILSQRDVDNGLYNILVVDNNSERNDETEIMLSEAQIPNLSYYKNVKNLGAGGNVNRCLTLAQGEWLVILHSDDILSPFFMTELNEAVKKHKDAACIQTLKTDISQINNYDITPKELRRFGKFDCYSGNIFGLPTGVAYNKRLLLAMGGFPHDKYQIYGFWTHVLCVNAGGFYCINKPLCAYRVSEANDSNDTRLQPTWIVYDYLLLKNLYHKYFVPRYIYEPYLSYHSKALYYGIKIKWKSDFDFPDEYIKIREFSQRRYKLSEFVLRMYAKVIRLLDDCIK